MKNYEKVIGIAVVILIFLCLSMAMNISGLKRDILGLNNQIQGLSFNINNIQSSVTSSVNQMLEEKKWLYNSSYSVENLSKDFKSIDVTFNWSLRELENGSKVYLAYGQLGEKDNEVTKWNEVPAQNMGNLSYRVKVTVPFRSNYQCKVVVKNKDKVTSEAINGLDFFTRLSGRLNIDARPVYKKVSGKQVDLTFSVNINNAYAIFFEPSSLRMNNDVLKIKNVSVKVYSNNVLEKEIVLMKDGVMAVKDGKYDNYTPNAGGSENISYSSSLRYDSVENSLEKIIVTVEDYTGRVYTNGGTIM